MVLPAAVEQAVILAREWAEQKEDWTRSNASVYATELLIIEKKIPQGMDIHNAIETQVLYLLCNLKGWRGPVAREVKRILNAYIN